MSIPCGLRSSRLYPGGKCGGDQAPRTLSASRRGRGFTPSAEQGFTGSEERTGEVATARAAKGLLGVETPRVSRVSTGGRVTALPADLGPLEKVQTAAFNLGPTPTPRRRHWKFS